MEIRRTGKRDAVGAARAANDVRTSVHSGTIYTPIVEDVAHDATGTSMRAQAPYQTSQLDRDTLRWLEPESDPLAAARGVVLGACVSFGCLALSLMVRWVVWVLR